VPEPATYAMLLAGLGMLGFAARKRGATKNAKF
ncbi:MAG TPA: PEP-CTERM sorting domain-containing protein, partial [Duganella sp.]